MGFSVTGTLNSQPLNGARLFGAFAVNLPQHRMTAASAAPKTFARDVGNVNLKANAALVDIDCLLHYIFIDRVFHSGNEIVMAILQVVQAQMSAIRLDTPHVLMTLDSRDLPVDHPRAKVSAGRRSTSKYLPLDASFTISDTHLHCDEINGISMGNILTTSFGPRIIFNRYIVDALFRYSAIANTPYYLTIYHEDTLLTTHPLLKASLAKHGLPGSTRDPLGPPRTYGEGDLKLAQLIAYCSATNIVPPGGRVLIFINDDTDTLVTACLPELNLTIWWVRTKDNRDFRCLDLAEFGKWVHGAVTRHAASTNCPLEVTPLRAMGTLYFWMYAIFGGDYLTRIRGPSTGDGVMLLTMGAFEPCVDFDPANQQIILHLRGIHRFLRAWASFSTGDSIKKLQFMADLPVTLFKLANNIAYYLYGVDHPENWNTGRVEVPWDNTFGRKNGDQYWNDSTAVWKVRVAPSPRAALDVYCCWELERDGVEVKMVPTRVRLCPALSITLEDIDEVINEGVCSNWTPPCVEEGSTVEAIVVFTGQAERRLDVHCPPPPSIAHSIIARLLVQSTTIDIIPHVVDLTGPQYESMVDDDVDDEVEDPEPPAKKQKPSLPKSVYNRYAHDPPTTKPKPSKLGRKEIPIEFDPDLEFD
jgi:hypothetical protein